MLHLKPVLLLVLASSITPARLISKVMKTKFDVRSKSLRLMMFLNSPGIVLQDTETVQVWHVISVSVAIARYA